LQQPLFCPDYCPETEIRTPVVEKFHCELRVTLGFNQAYEKIVERSGGVRYGWDENKRRENLRRRGIDFTSIAAFEWEDALFSIDDREDYGELREIALGFIGTRLHVVVFTEREVEEGTLIWIISLRKASRQEMQRYERAKR
jgi:uncharacterized DUF497 family protein